MFRSLALCLCTLALCAGPPEQSVVRVRSNPGCLNALVGSGVVVAPGIVVTNAHVVHGSQDLQVLKDGTSYRVQAHILAPEYDLCLLRIPALQTPPTELWEALPEIGQALEAWGYPGGTPHQVPVRVQGRLVATWRYRRNHLLQLEAPIVGGHSGGGLFLPDGRLVGITTFNLLGTGKTAFAVPVSWIRDLQERPWINGDQVPICKPQSVLLHELLDRLTEDPENRVPWEAFTRVWVASEPNQADAWYALGHVILARYLELSQTGTPDPAMHTAFLDAFQKAVTLNPAHVRAWNNLGVAFHAIGETRKSKEALEMALRLKPDYGLAWINLSSPLVDLLEIEAAILALKRGLALIPDDAAAWARLGICHNVLNQWIPAEHALRIAVRYRPFYRPWLLELAEVLHRSGQKQAFEAIRQQLETRDPEGLAELKRREVLWKPRRPVSPRVQ